MNPFSTLRKHQKTVRFSHLFKESRKSASGTNGLTRETGKWSETSTFVILVVMLESIKEFALIWSIKLGPILESKGMSAILQEKDKEMLKKGKIFEKMYQILKYFEKRSGDCVQ